MKKQDVNPLLWYLCSVGDHGRLSLLLSSLSSQKENLLHSKSPTGDTGLHYCVSGVKPHYKCLHLMLSYRSNPNTKNKMDFSPLHIACAKGFKKCASELLKNGADPDLVTKQGYRPIHYATMGGYKDCVELLFHKKAKINTLNDKMSILMIAAKYGNYKLIPFLISKGSKVNHQSFDGTTALHLAAENGNNRCCKLLMENGANVHSLNLRRQTPLHLATRERDLFTAKLLIEYGSDPNAKDRNLETPLHISVKDCQLKLSQLFLDSKANPHLKNYKGQTPLHFAANIGDPKLFMLLVDRRANLFEPDKAGNCAYNYLIKKGHNDLLLIAFDVCLMNAAFFNNREIVEKLLSMGADPNGSNFCSYLQRQFQENNKPVTAQTAYSHPIIHRRLSSHVRQSSPLASIDHNVSINSDSSESSKIYIESSLSNREKTKKEDFRFLNNRFSNSIVSSIFGQNPEITEKLISCLGNINTLDLFTGDNCLHKAVMTNNLYLIKFCLERGVEQFSTNKAGFTAFQLAKKLGLNHCVKYLYQSEEIYVNLLPGDKTPRVICGTTDRVIERFLINQEFDSKFGYYFLLMHRYFLNTKNLIQLFIDLFENAQEFVENCIFFPSKSKNKIKLVRLRIFKILKLWAEKIHNDFKQDKEIITQLLVPFLKKKLTTFKKETQTILNFLNINNNGIEKQKEGDENENGNENEKNKGKGIEKKQKGKIKKR